MVGTLSVAKGAVAVVSSAGVCATGAGTVGVGIAGGGAVRQTAEQGVGRVTQRNRQLSYQARGALCGPMMS